MKKNYIAPEVLIVDLNTEENILLDLSYTGKGEAGETVGSNAFEGGVDIWGENE